MTLDIRFLSSEDKKQIVKLADQIKKGCKHDLTSRILKSESVMCDICGKHLGWWCPDSSNHVCDYYGTHDGRYSAEHLSGNEYYDEDDCIYCHEPEERK